MTQDEIIEVMAECIFNTWQFAPQVKWIKGGNSVKQDDARAYARASINALTANGMMVVPTDTQLVGFDLARNGDHGCEVHGVIEDGKLTVTSISTAP